MAKKTLGELILEATEATPFLTDCVAALDRMEPIITGAGDLSRADKASMCLAAFLVLSSQPSREHLKSLQEALDEYESEEDFRN